MSSPGLQSTTLIDILRDRAIRQPEQVAYTFLSDGETQEAHLTYGELLVEVEAIAAQLQTCCEVGSRALLLYPPGLDYIAAFFGCLYAGVVAVPAYPPRPNRSLARLQTLVDDAQATVALTTSTLLTQLQQFPALDTLKWLTPEQVTEQATEQALGAPSAPKLTADSLAFLQYTSGSTATPKGVMISHANLLHNLAAIYHQFGHSPQSRGVIWLPPYHDMGLIGGILQPLYGGFPVVLMSPLLFMQSPIRWLRAISHYRATTSGGPNFAYEHCVQKVKPEQLADLDLSSWQVAFNGAEPIQAAVMERFSQRFAPYGFQPEAFCPCYGLAEATLMVAGKKRHTKLATLQRRPEERPLVSSGQPLAHQTLTILHPETHQPLPEGSVGEICVAGASVAQGYWNRPEETTQAFQATGLRTGDLGFLSQGELFVTGRLKDLLIMRGRNYYPQDIEQTVKNCHPSVSLNSGAAFAIEVDGVDQLVVMQEVDRSAIPHLDADAVLGSIRQSIAEHYDLQVHTLVLLKPGSIPKTSSGKIQRYVCRTNFLAGAWEGIAQWVNPAGTAEVKLPAESENGETGGKKEPPTASEIEDWLVMNLAIYLKISPDEIDMNQPFAYYGLDSSVAVSLTGELSTWLGINQLDPTLFWEYPSIEALAQHLGVPQV